jgi:hypothetical protein
VDDPTVIPLKQAWRRPNVFVPEMYWPYVPSSPGGRFEVFEAVYGANDEVLSFAADFEQFDWTGARALYGQIRHNSTIPIPEPASIFLAAVGLCAMATSRSQQLLRRNQSLTSGNRRFTSATNSRIPRIPRCACRMVLRFLYSVSLN